MKLTNAQTLIITMLADISETVKSNTDSGIDPKFIKKVLFSDNAWAISWQYPGLFGDSAEPTPPLVKEVVNYLDMWDFIETSYKKLTPEQKTQLNTDTKLSEIDFEFIGFDGNNETDHLNVADCLIKDLGRWNEFSTRDLNSHSPTVARYSRMYEAFKPLRSASSGKNLSLEQLKLIAIVA